jgi:glycosyltransferase involved in cell wall biosynthesis
MTAAWVPGDAIGNFIWTTRRLLERWGARVSVYADAIAPQYAPYAQHSRFYRSTGEALLWYHYSIYADNVELARASDDFKILDYHGISPPDLFAGQNSHLADLCRRGLELLPHLLPHFDHAIVHSDYTHGVLTGLGYPAGRTHKLPLVVDTSVFATAADPSLAQKLAGLHYYLLIGRIVPQKDILSLIEIFAHLHRHQPQAALILVGSRQHTPKYQRQIDDLVGRKGLEERVIFTGQVDNPAVLAELLRHARLLFVTSEWESFCVPVAEALFFGVPAVVHAVPPLPEIAGPAALVVDKRRPAEAARQVLDLLADDQRYHQMRQAALARSALYTDKALEANLLRLLPELVAD